MAEPGDDIAIFATLCMNFMNASLGLIKATLKRSIEMDCIIAEDPPIGETIGNLSETGVNIVVLSIELAHQLDDFLQLGECSTPQGLSDSAALIQYISKTFISLKDEFVVLRREYTKMIDQFGSGVKYSQYLGLIILPCFEKMIKCPVDDTGAVAENVIILLETRWTILSRTLDVGLVQSSAINDFKSKLQSHILSACLEAKILGPDGERVTTRIMDRPFVLKLLGSRITLEAAKCLSVLNQYPSMAPYWGRDSLTQLMDCEVLKILAHLEKSNRNESFDKVPTLRICSLYRDTFILLLHLFTSYVTVETRISNLSWGTKSTIFVDPCTALEPIMHGCEEIRRIYKRACEHVKTLIECLSKDLEESESLHVCGFDDTPSAKNGFDCMQCIMNILCRHARDVISADILGIEQWRWAVCEPCQSQPAGQCDSATYDIPNASVKSLFDWLSQTFTTLPGSKTRNLQRFLEQTTLILAISSFDSSSHTASDFPTSNNSDYLGLSLTNLWSLAEAASEGDIWMARSVWYRRGTSARSRWRPNTSHDQLRFNANSSASRRQWENEKSMSGRPSPSSSQSNIHPNTNGKRDTATSMPKGQGNSKSFQGDWSF